MSNYRYAGIRYGLDVLLYSSAAFQLDGVGACLLDEPSCVDYCIIHGGLI